MIGTLLMHSFRVHDWISQFLVKHLVVIKRTLLVLAHLSLFGFLFPEMRTDFGEWAANLLILILFLSPLSKIFRTRILLQLMGFRREMGIMMAYLATVHGLGYLLDPDWFDFIVRPYLAGDFWGPDPRYIFGILGYALTLPLLLTSNAWAQRVLGPNWKKLHQIVYALFVAAMLHRFIGVDMGLSDLVKLTGLLGTYVLLKLLAWKNFFPSLVRLNAAVAAQYEEYQAVKKSVVPTELVRPASTE